MGSVCYLFVKKAASLWVSPIRRLTQCILSKLLCSVKKMKQEVLLDQC